MTELTNFRANSNEGFQFIVLLQQNKVMELYAALKKDQRALCAYGLQLPSAEELKIMNVARMTPSQLFQLYTGSKKAEGKL